MVDERRARSGLFTVSIIGGGGEHKLQGVSNFAYGPDLIDPVSESTRLDQFSLPAQLNVDNLTLKEAPFAGCEGQPASNFYFKVLVNGAEIAHMRSVSGLGVNWEVMENRESTILNVQKLFNKRTIPEITLNQVIELNEGDPFMEQMDKLGRFQGPGRGFSVVGGANCSYRGTWTFILMDRAGGEVVRWNAYGMFPSKFQPIGDLEATSNEVGMRTLTLRSSPAYGVQNIEEIVSSWPGSGQIVSPDFLQWASRAFKIPERKQLMLNLYHPDALPGTDVPQKRWKLFNCWPSSVTYQDLDAGSPALCTREIVLATDGVRPV